MGDLFSSGRTKRRSDAILVVGLGRFGSAAAMSLVRQGQEVLAVDENERLVQRYADELTHVVHMDSTDEEALRQIGAGDFDKAVVAIGSDVEASIMTVLALVEVGVGEIWAKAITRKHGQILERIGAHHVVYPERSMGERVAHALASNMSEFMEFDDGFCIARTSAPRVCLSKTLVDSRIRNDYDITVVGVKRQGRDFAYAKPETEVHRGDELIICGRVEAVEAFCRIE